MSFSPLTWSTTSACTAAPDTSGAPTVRRVAAEHQNIVELDGFTRLGGQLFNAQGSPA
jgi:hypothetical protein